MARDAAAVGAKAMTPPHTQESGRAGFQHYLMKDYAMTSHGQARFFEMIEYKLLTDADY